MKHFLKAQLESKKFIQNYCSRQTIVTAILAGLVGFLPAFYQSYETIETRLLFVSIYGVLFFLFFILEIRWLYQATHFKEKEKKCSVQAMGFTIFHTLLSFLGIGALEWGIQRLYQSSIWEMQAQESYVYLHRASIGNSLFYPLLSALFLAPVLLAGCSTFDYGKGWVRLIGKSYLLLFLIGLGTSLLTSFLTEKYPAYGIGVAIFATFLLWSITITSYVSIQQTT